MALTAVAIIKSGRILVSLEHMTHTRPVDSGRHLKSEVKSLVVVANSGESNACLFWLRNLHAVNEV